MTGIGCHTLRPERLRQSSLWDFRCSVGGLADERAALRVGVKVRFGLDHSNGAAMRQSEFDKISVALDRAEFAIHEIRRKVDELTSRRAEARTLKEIAAIDLEADELLQQLRKVSDAIHTRNPAPHLRLVSDTD